MQALVFFMVLASLAALATLPLLEIECQDERHSVFYCATTGAR